MRLSDTVARFGGEEFVVLMPGGSGDAARSLAERLCAGLRETPIQLSEGPLGVTVSIGLAEASDADVDVERLLHRADEALYRAKSAGRNRVELATHWPTR